MKCSFSGGSFNENKNYFDGIKEYWDARSRQYKYEFDFDWKQKETKLSCTESFFSDLSFRLKIF